MSEESKGEIIKSFGGSRTYESSFVKKEEDGSYTFNSMFNVWNFDERRFDKKKVRLSVDEFKAYIKDMNGMIETGKELNIL